MKSFLFAFALLLIATTNPCLGNLILDGDFEFANSQAPAGPWIIFGVGDSDSAAPGINSSVEGSETLQLFGDGDYNVFSGMYQDIAVDGVNISETNLVELDGIVGHLAANPLTGTNEAFLEISFLDSMGVEFGYHRSAVINSASATGQYFHFFTGEHEVPVGATAVRVKAVFSQPGEDSGAGWYDNLNLTVTVPEPGSALMFASLSLLAFVRRR